MHNLLSRSLSLSPLQKLSIITVIQADWLTVETQRSLTLSHSELIFIILPTSDSNLGSLCLAVYVYLNFHIIYSENFQRVDLYLSTNHTLHICHSITLSLYVALSTSHYHIAVYLPVTFVISTNPSIYISCSVARSIVLYIWHFIYLTLYRQHSIDTVCPSIYPCVTLYTHHALSLSDTLSNIYISFCRSIHLSCSRTVNMSGKTSFEFCT